MSSFSQSVVLSRFLAYPHLFTPNSYIISTIYEEYLDTCLTQWQNLSIYLPPPPCPSSVAAAAAAAAASASCACGVAHDEQYDQYTPYLDQLLLLLLFYVVVVFITMSSNHAIPNQSNQLNQVGHQIGFYFVMVQKLNQIKLNCIIILNLLHLNNRSTT